MVCTLLNTATLLVTKSVEQDVERRYLDLPHPSP